MRFSRSAVAFAAAVLVLLIVIGWRFLGDPSATAPSRDPGWYTMHAGFLVDLSPSANAGSWGPDNLLGGGYRLTTATTGAVLEGTAGIDRFSFASILMVGLPVMTAMGVAGIVHRWKRDRAMALVTLLLAASLCFSASYVGYIDVLLWTMLMAGILALLPDARDSWGVRAVIGLIAFVEGCVLPGAYLVLVLVLVGTLLWRLWSARSDRRATLRDNGPGIAAACAGYAVSELLVLLRAWGPMTPATLRAAREPRAVYDARLDAWLWSLVPVLTLVLVVGAAVWIIRASRRSGKGIPFVMLAMLVWVGLASVAVAVAVGVTKDPVFVYQTVNPGLAVMVLAGAGLGLAVRALADRGGAGRWGAVALAVAVIGSMLAIRLTASEWTDTTNQWMDQSTRAAFAGVDAIVERAPEGTPVVFVIDAAQDPLSAGWAKSHTEAAFAAIGGKVAARSTAYFGSVEDLLAGRATPSADPTYAETANTFWTWARPKLQDAVNPPLVFVVAGLNRGGHEANQAPPPPSVSVAPHALSVVAGGGRFTPDDGDLAAGRSAIDRMTAHLREQGPFDDLAGSLWVALVIAALLVIPGAGIASALRLEDGLQRALLVPVLGFAAVLAAALVVSAIRRGEPFGGVHAWSSVAIAFAGAGMAWFVSRASRRATVAQQPSA